MALTIKTVTLFATLGVLLLFFFPVSFGSFQSTHGPTTALRAIQAIQGIFAALSSAALISLLVGNTVLRLAQDAVQIPEYRGQSLSCLRC